MKSSETLPHYSLTFIKDTPVPLEKDNRDLLSLPPGLVVKGSRLTGDVKGIFAEKFFPEGALFGPYEGDILCYDKDRTDESSNYQWVVSLG